MHVHHRRSLREPVFLLAGYPPDDGSRRDVRRKSIRDDIKENQLLYEVGERSDEEYQQRKQALESQLEMAEQVQEQMRDRMEVKK